MKVPNTLNRSSLGFPFGPLGVPSPSAGRAHSTVSFLCLILLGFVLQSEAKAARIPYPVSAFTLTNLNADGTAVSPDGGISVILTGGNNGSGLAGMTNLLVLATGPGIISFSYSYSSLDTPAFDWAGYVVGGVFSQLADTDGESGTASFPVASGDQFGFRVGTFDNTSEPGVFTVSGFSTQTSAPSTVPEPAHLGLWSAFFLLILIVLEMHKNIFRVPEKNS